LKINDSKPLYIILFIINVIWLFIFLQMTPLADDWGYVTTPLGGTLSIARPIDEILGVLLNTFPFLFPWFNRTLLLVFHFVNSIIFYKFAVNALKQKKYSGAFTLLFSISPWIYAAIAQTDSINQVLMFTFGIIGAYLYFKTENETRSNICYIVFTALSLCAKESGAAFLAVTPAVILIKVIHGELKFKTAVRRIFRSYLCGIALFAVYFFCFFVLRPYAALEVQNKTWKILFSKITFPAAVFTGVNTFDVQNGFWLSVSLGLVLSAPLVLYAFVNFVKMAKLKDKRAFTALILFIFGELFILPTQLFYYVADMHMYPFLFFALLIILYFLPKNEKRLINILLAMYFASFIISDAAKIYRQDVSSGYVRGFQAEASKLIGGEPAKIYTIFPHFSIVDRGIYYQNTADDWFIANNNGKSLYSIYGYDVPIHHAVYYSVDEIEGLIRTAPDGCAILVVKPDKAMESVKN